MYDSFERKFPFILALRLHRKAGECLSLSSLSLRSAHREASEPQKSLFAQPRTLTLARERAHLTRYSRMHRIRTSLRITVIGLLLPLACAQTAPQRARAVHPQASAQAHSNVPLGSAPQRVWRDVQCRLAVCCALSSTHQAFCWGGNSRRYFDATTALPRGRSGRVYELVTRPSTAQPITVEAVDELMLTESAVCLRRGNEETSLCYGLNGTLLRATPTTPPNERVAARMLPEGIVGIVRKRGYGDNFGCALTDEGSVWCWGANESGQLGTGDFVDRERAVRVPGLSAVTRLSVASRFACAITDGTVVCWGDPALGRTHSAPTAANCERHEVQLGSPVKFMAVGWAHSCALLENGSVCCWGLGTAGQLGDPRLSARPPLQTAEAHFASLFRTRAVPQEVGRIPTATELFGGDGYTCARTPSQLSCWGALYSREFQTADETQTPGQRRNVSEPIHAPTLLSASASIEVARRFVSAHESGALVVTSDVQDPGSCARRGESRIWCDFSAATHRSSCSELALASDVGAVVGIAISSAHACAWTSLGRAFCWGDNSLSQVGSSREQLQPRVVLRRE